MLARLDNDGDAAGLGELDGVAGKIEQNLAQAGGVAHDADGQALVDERRDLDAFRLGARRQKFDCFLDQCGQYERPRFQIELAGLDLGEIKNLFDQR